MAKKVKCDLDHPHRCPKCQKAGVFVSRGGKNQDSWYGCEWCKVEWKVE